MEYTLKDTEVKLAGKQDLWQIRELALYIFPFTYKEILEEEQIDYMMDMFYKAENLVAQFDAGQAFLIIYSGGKPTGFAGYSPLNENGYFKLNKIYLDFREQGKGIGRTLMNEVITRIKADGGKTLQLNVNKNNKAVGFYLAMGFAIKESVSLDIGNGYFMDDFVMEKNFTHDV
jgi:ribosomal protein S18 acetylase RimI-like enzyme